MLQWEFMHIFFSTLAASMLVKYNVSSWIICSKRVSAYENVSRKVSKYCLRKHCFILKVNYCFVIGLPRFVGLKDFPLHPAAYVFPVWNNPVSSGGGRPFCFLWIRFPCWGLPQSCAVICIPLGGERINPTQTDAPCWWNHSPPVLLGSW